MCEQHILGIIGINLLLLFFYDLDIYMGMDRFSNDLVTSRRGTAVCDSIIWDGGTLKFLGLVIYKRTFSLYSNTTDQTRVIMI